MGQTGYGDVLTKSRKRDALEVYFKMPVAEFGGIRQHDRGLMALRVIAVGEARMMTVVLVMMIVA
jgi:hypothetical protein